MPKLVQMTLSGWGNYPKADCAVSFLRHRQAAFEHLEGALEGRGAIARGLGRCYADQALNDGGRVVDCTPIDRYLAFDHHTGVLTCEAGASLGDIIKTFAPQGWFPMITPGTKFVTVGGCIASDVHGKAHHKDGCFSNCVRAFTILLADGSMVTASRTENADLFWANFGGQGLLGIILMATIQLRRVETSYFKQTAVRARDLDELLDALDEYDARFPYSVAWVDSLAHGRSLGRGVLTVGEAASVDELPRDLRDEPLRVSPSAKLAVPFNLPELALNPLSIRVLNAIIEQVQARGAAIAHYEKFFYPLDAVGAWNRGYGRRGFTQYQFVVPLKGGRPQLRAILEKIAGSGFLPFLNVLKRFGASPGASDRRREQSPDTAGRSQGPMDKTLGREQQGVLSFPFEGYTFAIDFPIAPGLGNFTRMLDAMVLDAGGRVYLAKDAFLDAPTFQAMYPQHREWLQVKARYDADEVFTSSLGRRIGLTAR